MNNNQNNDLNNSFKIIDLTVGHNQKYTKINEALNDCKEDNTHYNIKISSGIYEEIITLPENCFLHAIFVETHKQKTNI